MLNGLDLFAGIGGITIALEDWVRPVAYCEIERYAQAVLLSRMSDGSIPAAPIWDDVTTLNRSVLESAGIGPIDIITGGFPCQDISTAGNGVGVEGQRSGLFREIIRLAVELRPQFLYLENVAAITFRGLGTVLGELAEIRYDCRYGILSAADMGAQHLRERWWLLAADTTEIRHRAHELPAIGKGMGQFARGNNENDVTDSEASGFETFASQSEQDQTSSAARSGRFNRQGSDRLPDFWRGPDDESPVCRKSDGIPFARDRIASLGNAVVPQTAREAFCRLMGIKKGK